jgi:hypothetical protein
MAHRRLANCFTRNTGPSSAFTRCELFRDGRRVRMPRCKLPTHRSFGRDVNRSDPGAGAVPASVSMFWPPPAWIWMEMNSLGLSTPTHCGFGWATSSGRGRRREMGFPGDVLTSSGQSTWLGPGQAPASKSCSRPVTRKPLRRQRPTGASRGDQRGAGPGGRTLTPGPGLGGRAGCAL